MAVRPMQFTLKFPFYPSSSSSAVLLRCFSFNAATTTPLAGIQIHKHKKQTLNQPSPSPSPTYSLRPTSSRQSTLAHKIGKAVRRPGPPSKARVYTDVNVVRPKDYSDYESLTVQWGLGFL